MGWPKNEHGSCPFWASRVKSLSSISRFCLGGTRKHTKSCSKLFYMITIASIVDRFPKFLWKIFYVLPIVLLWVVELKLKADFFGVINIFRGIHSGCTQKCAKLFPTFFTTIFWLQLLIIFFIFTKYFCAGNINWSNFANRSYPVFNSIIPRWRRSEV
jgi:hypothetical protein